MEKKILIIGLLTASFLIAGPISPIVADIPNNDQTNNDEKQINHTAPNIAWAVEFSDVMGVFTEAQETPDGGYIAVGSTTTGFFNSDLADIPYDFLDVLLIKVDRNGNRQWMKTFGGANQKDGGFSVIQTRDGGFAICGKTVVQDYHYAWLIKTDKEGNEKWNRKFGGGYGAFSRFDAGYCVRQTPDGGFILAGKAAKYAGYYDIADAWLIKINAKGNEEWNRTYDAGLPRGTELGYNVDITNDNGFLLTGYRGNENPHKGAGWIIKTNSYGKEEWNKTFYKFPYGDADILFSTKQISDGGYIAIGYFTDGESGERRFWVIRMNTQGEIIWDTTYDIQDDGLYSIGYSLDETTSRGQFVLSGYKEIQKGESFRSMMWIVKIDANGQILWDMTYDFGTPDDVVTIQTARSVQQTSDKGFIVAGMRHTMSPWIWYPSLIKIKPEVHTGTTP